MNDAVLNLVKRLANDYGVTNILGIRYGFRCVCVCVCLLVMMCVCVCMRVGRGLRCAVAVLTARAFDTQPTTTTQQQPKGLLHAAHQAGAADAREHRRHPPARQVWLLVLLFVALRVGRARQWWRR